MYHHTKFELSNVFNKNYSRKEISYELSLIKDTKLKKKIVKLIKLVTFIFYRFI